MPKKLAILAALTFLGGLVVLVVVTLLYFSRVVPQAGYPVAEFDAGVARELAIEDVRDRFILCVLLDSRESVAPDVSPTIVGGDGAEIAMESLSGPAHSFGRHYSVVGRFKVERPATIMVTVEAEPTADFAVFRDTSDVFLRNKARALPGWITGGVLLGASICLIVVILAASERRFERGFHGGMDG